MRGLDLIFRDLHFVVFFDSTVLKPSIYHDVLAKLYTIVESRIPEVCEVENLIIVSGVQAVDVMRCNVF